MLFTNKTKKIKNTVVDYTSQQKVAFCFTDIILSAITCDMSQLKVVRHA